MNKTNITTNVTFTLDGAAYEETASGEFYCTPTDGKKTRIDKLTFNAAFHEYVARNVDTSDETCLRNQIEIESENPEIEYDTVIAII